MTLYTTRERLHCCVIRSSSTWRLGRTDGTEATAGVLANDVDATLADRADALLIARHAFAASRALVWPAGITLAQKTAATAPACG